MTHTLTFLAGTLLAAVLTWNVQVWRYDAMLSKLQTAHAKAFETAALQALNDQERLDAQYKIALNAARAREQRLIRDRDAARAESDGMREQAADAARRLTEAPPATVLEYATTANELFVDCGRRYTELAEKADGHATDVRTLTEAWPTSPP